MAIRPNMAPKVRPLISCWIKYSIPSELLPAIAPFEPWRRPHVVCLHLKHASCGPQHLRKSPQFDPASLTQVLRHSIRSPEVQQRTKLVVSSSSPALRVFRPVLHPTRAVAARHRLAGTPFGPSGGRSSNPG